MDITLKLFLLVGVIIYFAVIIYFVKKGTLNLKYSLLWLATGMVMFILVLLPDLLVMVSSFLGIASPMNALFACILFFVMLISVSITAIVSKLNSKVKTLIQYNSLLEKRIRELEGKGEKH